MQTHRSFVGFVWIIGISLGSIGCAHEQSVARASEAANPQTTQRFAPPRVQTAGHAVHVSDEIMRACNIDFSNLSRAPKFDFNDSGLSSDDRSILQQVARCLTTGPLKGRSLKLVGRADPRGETEYNMVLGQSRASSVSRYLNDLGLSPSKITATSRGELDASGKDESGWQQDRRVDLLLI